MMMAGSPVYLTTTILHALAPLSHGTIGMCSLVSLLLPKCQPRVNFDLFKVNQKERGFNVLMLGW